MDPHTIAQVKPLSIGPWHPVVYAQAAKWSLDHRWDISEASVEMVTAFKAKYDLK